MFEFRQHGANPEKMYAAFGMDQPPEVIDFSTNTNALSWRGTLALDPERFLSEYPDDECTALRAFIAGKNRCAPDEVLVTNGSNEAIYLLASLTSGKKNAILQPVFGEYARALAAWDAHVENIFSLEDAAAGYGAVWLCNPCNPMGWMLGAAALSAKISAAPETLFIVDEAYVDFLIPDEERIPHRAFSNLIILRSLTKIYSLCGARAGYVIARASIVEQMKKRQPTWSVNRFAQEASLAFLRDDSFLRETKAYYRLETPRLTSAIEAAGYRVLPTTVNFFLVETADDLALIRFLMQRGLVVRHTRNFPGLEGKFVRIAVRKEKENDKLIHALREFRDADISS